MCSPATCRTCGKTTWSGCGMHVKQVMKNVPAAQQCTCNAPAVQTAGTTAAPGGGLRTRFRRR